MINLQNTSVVNIHLLNDKDLNYISIDELMETMSFVENVHLYSRIHSNFILHHHHFIVGSRLTEISANMNELYNNSVYEGSFLSAPNEGMVGRRIANLYGVEVNDVFKIGNSEFIFS
jgi:hypothetical protein